MSASHRLSGHQQRQKLREVMSEKAGVTGEFLLRTETVHQRPPWLSSTCLARHTRDVHEAAAGPTFNRLHTSDPQVARPPNLVKKIEAPRPGGPFHSPGSVTDSKSPCSFPASPVCHLPPGPWDSDQKSHTL